MLVKLAKIAELKDYIEGLYHWRRPSAEKMWLILQGAISLTLENDQGETIELEKLQDGDVLGFSSFVDIKRREYLSDARVITPIRAGGFSFAQTIFFHYAIRILNSDS